MRPPTPSTSPYDYQVPGPGLLPALQPGVRLSSPFGAGNRRIQGLVLAVEQGVPAGEKPLKQVQTVLDDSPVLTPGPCAWPFGCGSGGFAHVYDAARAMLPAGLYYSLQDRWHIADGVDRPAAYEAAGKSENAPPAAGAPLTPATAARI